MTNENRYYKTPFAESGNKAEVPDVSTGGAVGYDTGFGPDYELPQGSLNRKRIERPEYNGVLNGVTKNLKQWQEELYPTWIEDDGTGVAFSYPVGMIVAHAAQNWLSLEAANQEEPGAGNKWAIKVSNINELSITHDFENNTLMANSDLIFPLKKKLATKSGVTIGDNLQADYIVGSSQLDADHDILLSDGKYANWQPLAKNQDTLKLYQDAPTDAQIQSVIDNSAHASKLTILNGSTYTKNIQWKGRRHETSDLPFLLNSAPIVSGALNARMQVVDGVLYVCEFANNKIGVFTLDDPRSPLKVAEVATGNSPRHVAVFGKVMAVANRASNTVVFYDISDLSAIIQVGSIATAAGPKMFELRGCSIYVVCAEDRKLQKFTFSLNNQEALTGNSVGGFVFNSQLIYSVDTCIDPLCCSVNEIGTIVVSGSGANVYLHGEVNGLVTKISSFGGSGHGFCEWISSERFLLSDWQNSQVKCINATDQRNPALLSSVNVVNNPEQITVIGDRFYVPQLEVGVTAHLSAVDITDNLNMFEYKQVPLSVGAAGFTAYYQQGETGYLYVNGHTAPFNIDVVEVVAGKFKDNTEDFTDTIGARNAQITSLNAGHNTMRHSFDSSINASRTQDPLDHIVRMGSVGTVYTYTMLDPATLPNKQITIMNVGTVDINIANSFLGFSGTVSGPGAITLLATKFGSNNHWEVLSSHGTIT